MVSADGSEAGFFLALHLPNGKHPHVPSWCPDWNTTKDYNPFRNYSSLQAGCENIGHERPPIHEVDGTDHICVRGVRVDEVLEVVESEFPDSVRYQRELNASSRFEAEHLEPIQRVYGYASDALPEEHWRTLVANEINGVPCSQEHEADCFARSHFCCPQKVY